MGGERAGVVLLFTLISALPAISCRRGARVEPAPARVSASARAEPPAHSAPKARAPAVVHGCRVLGVKGRTPPPPGTPATGTLLRGAAWLDLAPGVELELKHTETTRELSLLGPGRFLACARGAEAVVVASGSVVTTPGPGSRAGAEVELATPFGVVHYADAALRLDVSEQALELAVTQGSAAVSATANEARDGGAMPAPVRAPHGRLSLRGKVESAPLVAECAEARGRVAGPTASAPSAGPDRGAWAVSLLQARRTARLACARARAAAGRSEGGERDRLEDQLSAPLAGQRALEEPPAGVGESAAGK
jgi:hypothetical protein